jgi:hypothetical protein
MHIVSLFPIADDIRVRMRRTSYDNPEPPVPVEDRPMAKKFQGRLLIQDVSGRHDFPDFINAGSSSFHTLTIVYCGYYEQISRLISTCGSSLKTFRYSSAYTAGNSSFDRCDLGHR